MTDSITEPKKLTRASRFGIELRLAKTYGCSPFSSRIWLAYMTKLGMRCPMVESTMARAIGAGRRPLDNLHGQQARSRSFSYGERLVREAIAREQRGERFAMLARQAG
jgi:hypothetical protein